MNLNNEVIEVACGALWLVKSRGAADEVQQRPWDRLQSVRTGDYGGSARIDLAPPEVDAAVRALQYVPSAVPLDGDEQSLLARLMNR